MNGHLDMASAFWLVIGIAIGVAIGVGMGNVAEGIAVGIAIGIALMLAQSTRKHSSDSGENEKISESRRASPLQGISQTAVRTSLNGRDRPRRTANSSRDVRSLPH